MSKFVRRHRWAVAAGLLGALGLLLGLAAAVLQERPLAVLGALGLVLGLSLALVQARRAAVARDLAQRHLLRARAIARDVVERHAQAIQFLPGGAALQAQMLGDLVGHLQSLLQQNEADLTLTAELACAHARLAHLQSEQPLLARLEFDAAQQHATQALQLFGRCSDSLRSNQHIWHARAWRARAAVARSHKDLPQALEAAAQMAAVLQASLRAHGPDPSVLAELGSAHFVRGQLLFAWGLPSLQRPEEADKAYAKAAAAYESLLAKTPDQADERHQLATAQGARMMVAFTLGDTAAAITLGEQALAARELNLAQQPDHVAMRNALVSEALNLSYVLMESGQPVRALDLADLGLKHLQQLASADPGHTAWAHAMVRAGLHRARPLVALQRAQDALPLLQALTEPDAPPERTGGPNRAAWARLELARAWHTLGDGQRAQEALGEAPEYLAKAAQAAPQDALLQRLHVQGQAVRQLCAAG
jgi:tetratricopeptide (TPR) repeat protein